MDKLVNAYLNTFTEFLGQGKLRLRLVPIAGGVHSGDLKEGAPYYTVTAIKKADGQLPYAVQEEFSNFKVTELCVYEGKEHRNYKEAHQWLGRG